MIARPPSPFPPIADAQIRKVPAGSVLHRIHGRAFGGTSFNPCKGKPSRFAPIHDAAGACVPSLYAGTNLACVAFETVLHDIPPDAAFKTVRHEAVVSRAHSEIAPLSPLRLVGLFEQDLRRWRMTRAQLIDTPASDYAATARWAEAIHRARSDAHGLVWTSRQFDPEQAILLFGDRVGTQSLKLNAPTRTADAHSPLFVELHALADRYGITILLPS